MTQVVLVVVLLVQGQPVPQAKTFDTWEACEEAAPSILKLTSQMGPTFATCVSIPVDGFDT